MPGIPHFAPYRLLGVAAAPLARWYLDARAAQGKEDPARLAERLGRASRPRPEGPLLWLHGASVGESLSALPLIERLRATRPALGILVTTGTVTSARLMAERLPAGVLHQYAPLDLPAAVARFFDHWRPDLGLILESELWPNLLGRARTCGCELVLLNGRMSARSARRWAWLRPVIRRLLGHFTLVLAQSAEDAARLADLGAASPRDLGNLKAAAPPLAADPAALAALAARLAERPRWLAASTHAGEEGTVAAVHEGLAPSHPGLLTLIVPRHPRRGPEIAAGLRRAGYRVARRGAGDDPEPATEIYLADTLGELGLWYRLAGIVFVGGSLVPHGGQNLLEPARLGCAVICGPHVGNFRRLAEEMAEVGALRQVADGPELGREVAALLGDPALRAARGENARAFGAAKTEMLEAVLQALAPALDRAIARASLDPAARIGFKAVGPALQREDSA